MLCKADGDVTGVMVALDVFVFVETDDKLNCGLDDTGNIDIADDFDDIELEISILEALICVFVELESDVGGCNEAANIFNTLMKPLKS